MQLTINQLTTYKLTTKMTVGQESRPHNTGFATGGVPFKLGALCSETRPNAKPENVIANTN